jgi:hypothetical protein
MTFHWRGNQQWRNPFFQVRRQPYSYMVPQSLWWRRYRILRCRLGEQG